MASLVDSINRKAPVEVLEKTSLPKADKPTASTPTMLSYGSDPSSLQAQVIDAQREDFSERFRPLEDRLMGMISQNGNEQADKASGDIRTQAKITRQSFNRDIRRAGIQPTEDQKQSYVRARGLDLARSQANAENSTRARVKDDNMQATANLIGIGRNVQQGVNEDLATASSLQSGREQAGAQAKAQRRAQTTSMVTTGLGLLSAIFL